MVFTLTAILISSIGVTPAFAQTEDPIVVTTDRDSYSAGDTIIVSGVVRDLIGQAVSVMIISPNTNIVAIAQVNVNDDKTFSAEITAGGTMKFDGTYTVRVTYGGLQRTAETTFDLSGAGVGPGPGPGGPSIDVEGYTVGYSITGGSILSITADVDANSLIIEISTTSDGELTIILPRALIDAKLNGDDDEFFVLVDAEEVDFDETKTDTHRTLTIAFFDGSEEIEIIGTFVIPEFGAIAALILAVAIISIIVVSAKTRLSLIPRY